MIVKSPYGVSPDIEVTIGGATVDYNTMYRVELILEENQHDMLVIEVSGIPPRAITDYYGKPVQLTISTGPRLSQRFNGYVEDVRPVSLTAGGLMNKSPFQAARIVCMGASYNLRGSTSRTWVGYKLSTIAKELAQKHRLSLDVPSDDYVNETLAQTNESDWQFLVRYAKQLGYRVNVHGTHMHVYDPQSALSRQTFYHELTSLITSGRGIDPQPGQVMEFSGTFSRRNIDGEYKESEIAVLSKDNVVYNLKSTTLTTGNGTNRFPNRVGDFVDNLAEANRRLRAEDRADYDYYADVTTIGIAGCVPGSVLKLNRYDASFDGYWYVQSVKHVAHTNAFTTELRLAKNVKSELKFDNTKPFQIPPVSQYDRDRWVSQKARVNEY